MLFNIIEFQGDDNLHAIYMSLDSWLWCNWYPICFKCPHGILSFFIKCLSCSNIFYSELRYLGCYRDQWNRDLPVRKRDVYVNAKDTCATLCKDYRYFGLQSGTECFCGDTFGKYGKSVESKCNRSCKDDKTQICGGWWRNSVYQILSKITTSSLLLMCYLCMVELGR